MNMKLKRSIRELMFSPRRTLLVILALVLGIWGVGTVLVSYSILTQDLDANFQSTVPPHLILESSDFGKLSLAELQARPEVESAEFRDFSMERIEVHPNVWIPLRLNGIQDFNDLDLAKVFPEAGERVPPDGTMLIERNGMLVSNIQVGSTPAVRIGRAVKQVPVSGICFDPAQAPATQDAFIFAYCSQSTFRQITGKPSGQRLILRLNEVNSGKEVAAVAEKLSMALAQNGIRVSNVDIPVFNAHPHQWQLNTILFLIGAIGFLAFVMGAVLVSQLMRAVLQSQVRQIGILKAIGASRFQIFQIYLGMLLAIGLVAGAIAVPLSAASGMAYSRFVAGILNFEVLSSVSIPIYLALGLASLLLPIVLSLPPLLKSTNIPVLDALHDYGISGNGSRNLRFLARLPLSDSMRLAFRNTLRNSRRLAVTVVTMALGVAIFNTGFNVRQSLWELLNGVKTEMRYDVQVVLKNQVDRQAAMAPFHALSNVKKLEMWTGGRGELQSRVISTNTGAGIVALPWDSELLQLKIVQGRALAASDEMEVVLNQQAWERYDQPQVGSMLRLMVRDTVQEVKLVGIAEQFDQAKIYMDQGQFDALINPDHRVNSLMFVAENNGYEDVLQLKRDIEAAIVPSDLEVLYVMSHAERVKIIYDHLDIILSVILFLSLLVLLVSGVGMASATSINIWERTREIGVMRAIGATQRRIYRQFLQEGMIVCVWSIVLGLLISYPLSQLAAVFFGTLILGEGTVLAAAFSLNGFAVTLLVTGLFGWLASRIPARAGIRIATWEALSYE